MPDHQTLSRLLGSLYDAAGDPKLWPEFLRFLSKATHGSGAAITLHNPNQAEHAVLLHSGYDADAVKVYEKYYASRDIWLQKVYPTSYSGWVGASEEFCPTGEFLRTEIYGDFFRQVDIAHAMWATINHPRDGRTNFLGVYRDRKQGRFSPRDLELLHFLLPHTKRAFRLHFQFADLRQKVDDLQFSLDHVDAGIVLIGSTGEVIAMNRYARMLFAEEDGLTIRADVLRAREVRVSDQLHSLITQALATSIGKGLSPGGYLTVPRKDRSPLSILVTPARCAAVGVPFEAVRAIVYVQDPERRVRPAQEILRSAFRLTPAECRVTLLLGDGKSPREISHVLGVSSNTLKSHLASIYRKTNTSRQSQLVRLLMRLPASTV